MIKGVDNKCTTNLIHGELSKVFPLRLQTRPECPLSLLLVHSVPVFSASAKRNKQHRDWKGKNDIIIIRNLYDSQHRKSI